MGKHCLWKEQTAGSQNPSQANHIHIHPLSRILHFPNPQPVWGPKPPSKNPSGISLEHPCSKAQLPLAGVS